MIGYTQYSTSYKEFNAGLYVGSDIVFPGCSFLFGKTKYYSNNMLLDYEIGVALPTVATAKIGAGIGDNSISAIIGIRPWPTSIYFQWTWQEKRLLSIEVMLPYENSFGADSDFPIIFNYGYRW